MIWMGNEKVYGFKEKSILLIEYFKMFFCPQCQNKLYPSESEDKLMNLCIKCGYESEYTESLIHKKIYKGGVTQSANMNSFSRFDVSLPRTSKKICPNKECESHLDKTKQEAVFIMDPVTLKMTYMCTCCGTEWKYD